MAFLTGLTSILNLILAIYVFVNNPSKKNNRIFSVLALITSLWCFANFMLWTNKWMEYPWMYLTYSLGALMPPLIFYWIIDFVEYKVNRYIVGFVFLISIFLAIISLIPNMVLKDYFILYDSWIPFNMPPGNFFTLYAVMVMSIVLIALYLLIRRRNKLIGLKRLQCNYVLLGIGIPAAFIFTFNFIFYIFGIMIFARLDALAPFFFIGLVTYSITRHRLLDIPIVLKRGAVYIISLFLTLAIYTYLALLLKETIEESWDINPSWTAFILVALVALGFPPLKSLVEKSINTLFKGRKSIDLAVKELQEKITKKTDVETLIELVSKEIKKFLEVDEAKLFVIDRQKKQFVWQDGEGVGESIDPRNDILRYFDKYRDVLIVEEIAHRLEGLDEPLDRERLQKAEKEMRKRKISLAMPLYTEDEVFGVILLGERPQGKAYTVEDVKYLEQLREQVSSVLAYALLYRDAMERIKVGAII